MKKSNKLLRFTLDDGTGTDRQILSGIAMWYKPEELVGKTLMAIVNLPPRKMMGLESNGMLISAVHTERGEEKLNLLILDDAIPPAPRCAEYRDRVPRARCARGTFPVPPDRAGIFCPEVVLRRASPEAVPAPYGGGRDMDYTALAVAGMSLVGTLAGTFGGILVANKLTAYRLEQLERRVGEHNKLVERTYKLEGADGGGPARHPGSEGGEGVREMEEGLEAAGQSADHQEHRDPGADGGVRLADLRRPGERRPVLDGVHGGRRLLFWDPGGAVRQEKTSEGKENDTMKCSEYLWKYVDLQARMGKTEGWSPERTQGELRLAMEANGGARDRLGHHRREDDRAGGPERAGAQREGPVGRLPGREPRPVRTDRHRASRGRTTRTTLRRRAGGGGGVTLYRQFLTRNDCYAAGRTITPQGGDGPLHRGQQPQCEPVRPRGRRDRPQPRRQPLGPAGGWPSASTPSWGRLPTGAWPPSRPCPGSGGGGHAGSGTSGHSANDTHISFEICEDDLDDQDYFAAVYQAAVELTALLCRQYGLDPLADGVVICHQEGYRRGIASNHADVLHWFPKFGRSMDDFRADVAALIREEDDTVSYEQWKQYMDRYRQELGQQQADPWRRPTLPRPSTPA